MQTHNAIIKKADLQLDDRGILTAWLDLEYDGIVGYFGNIVLYLPPNFKNHNIKSTAGHFIYRVMQVADVTDWGDLVGKPVRVVVSSANPRDVFEIGHITKEDWFCPKADFSK